jgi:chemotaxis protein CheD
MSVAEECAAEVYVQPGESHLVRGPTILRTVLGSCVGVTFWNRRLGLGGLCHPMLPAYPAHKAKLSLEASRRYVDFTVRDLAAQLDALGATRRETEVKLFGGADVLLVTDRATRPTVGQLNGEAALRVLASEGYAVAASSLGGQAGLHIDFYTATGEVLLRRLNATGVLHRGGRGRRDGA